MVAKIMVVRAEKNQDHRFAVIAVGVAASLV